MKSAEMQTSRLFASKIKDIFVEFGRMWAKEVEAFGGELYNDDMAFFNDKEVAEDFATKHGLKIFPWTTEPKYVVELPELIDWNDG